MSTLLILGGLSVILFGWLRLYLMANQVETAVRRELSKTAWTLIRLRNASVFRDCGSVSAALAASLSIHDYYAFYRTKEGREEYVRCVADFVPIVGRLRSVQMNWNNNAKPNPA